LRIFLDSCIAKSVKFHLLSEGYDVEWCGDWSSDPGDEEILSYTRQEKRILVTLDKDFGELAIVKKIPHCGILRFVNMSIKKQSDICSRMVKKYGELLQAGGMVTVESNRVRIRPPEGFEPI